MVPEIEKLGAFYLGKEWDRVEKKVDEMPFMIDSKDFVTHAVCMGMTGSGKTGLCISLLEEAAIDGIPAIVVDPKGDIANLALTFPNLQGTDFLPWINSDDARKKGMSVEDFANSQAEFWKKGLAKWNQDGERIKLLRESSNITIYTPGSSAGQALSILKSMDAPSDAVLQDEDVYGDTISGTVSGILGLLGIDADPLQSREHILLSSILDYSWRKGQSLDLVDLVVSVQTPPIKKIGVFDLDTFYPSKDRFKLAMSLNNLLASPKFQVWTKGTPLDIDNLLYTKEGKPKISIISIAHLDDKERMFTVSLLLNRLLGWMRSQSGTTSLRALLYMDEIFGYLPPVSNPPTKKPLLTLLKQARAFGLGLVLATQNPVDLDYKGLSNTGMWFIGRLQTERDKKRVLDGLSGTDLAINSTEMENLLSSLDKRVFLMHSVHEDKPVLFHTRWVMSYLRGPLTREQIKKFKKEESLEVKTNVSSNREAKVSEKHLTERPVLPPELEQVFLPVDRNIVREKKVCYVPAYIAQGSVYFTDKKSSVAMEKKYLIVSEAGFEEVPEDWEDCLSEMVSTGNFQQIAYENCYFEELPAYLLKKKYYSEANKKLRQWMYRNISLKLFRSSITGLISKPSENERDFRIRIQQKAREVRDSKIEKLRSKFQLKIKRLEDKMAKAEEKIEKEEMQAKASKVDTAISIGATIFGMFLGRKKLSRTTISRAGTSMRRAGRISKEKRDVELAKERLNLLVDDLSALEEKLQNEISIIKEETDCSKEQFETVVISPKKINTSVTFSALGWVPYAEVSKGRMEKALRK